LLEQPEVDLKRHGHTYWLSVFLARLKEPRARFFHRLLVQPHAQAANNFQIPRTSVRPDDRRENHRTLKFCFSRFLGEIRFRRELGNRRGYADITQRINPATVTSTLPRTMAGASP